GAGRVVVYPAADVCAVAAEDAVGDDGIAAAVVVHPGPGGRAVAAEGAVEHARTGGGVVHPAAQPAASVDVAVLKGEAFDASGGGYVADRHAAPAGPAIRHTGVNDTLPGSRSLQDQALIGPGDRLAVDARSDDNGVAVRRGINRRLDGRV